jgi:hypothetical protein
LEGLVIEKDGILNVFGVSRDKEVPVGCPLSPAAIQMASLSLSILVPGLRFPTGTLPYLSLGVESRTLSSEASDNSSWEWDSDAERWLRIGGPVGLWVFLGAGASFKLNTWEEETLFGMLHGQLKRSILEHLAIFLTEVEKMELPIPVLPLERAQAIARAQETERARNILYTVFL